METKIAEKDNIMPEERWVFGQEVAKCFSDMLQRSIPGYESMREAVFQVGNRFLHGDGAVLVDLGCSNGLGSAPFIEYWGASLSAFLVDNSPAMIEQAVERYQYRPNVTIQQMDISEKLPDVRANLILGILTLQFVPIEERHRVFTEIYKHTAVNGAFILVEKVLGDNLQAENLLTEYYYDCKRGNGYSEDQIAGKRKALRGVLVPIQSEWNEHMLRNAGFSNVIPFWQYLNFKAWLAIK